MKRQHIIPLPNLIPALLDSNSEEYKIFAEALTNNVMFDITWSFINDLDEYLKSAIQRKEMTKFNAEKGKRDLISKLTLHKTGYYNQLREVEKMGFDDPLNNVIALHFWLENSMIWGVYINEELKTNQDRLQIKTTPELKQILFESYRVYAETISESENLQDQNVSQIDPRYEEIEAVSSPAGFYPGFVKWAVEEYGFLDASDPTKGIKIKDLPDPWELDVIRFIQIANVREETQTAEMEVIEYEQQSPAIPYWGLIISLEKKNFGLYKGNPYLDFTYFRLTIDEKDFPLRDGYFIFGIKGNHFKNRSNEWADPSILKEKYGILLGNIRYGFGGNYIQIFFYEDQNKHVSLTLDINKIKQICQTEIWAKKISVLGMPSEIQDRVFKEGK